MLTARTVVFKSLHMPTDKHNRKRTCPDTCQQGASIDKRPVVLLLPAKRARMFAHVSSSAGGPTKVGAHAPRCTFKCEIERYKGAPQQWGKTPGPRRGCPRRRRVADVLQMRLHALTTSLGHDVLPTSATLRRSLTRARAMAALAVSAARTFASWQRHAGEPVLRSRLS